MVSFWSGSRYSLVSRSKICRHQCQDSVMMRKARLGDFVLGPPLKWTRHPSHAMGLHRPIHAAASIGQAESYQCSVVDFQKELEFLRMERCGHDGSGRVGLEKEFFSADEL